MLSRMVTFFVVCIASGTGVPSISIHFETPGKSLDITGDNMEDVLQLVDALSYSGHPGRDLRPYTEETFEPYLPVSYEEPHNLDDAYDKSDDFFGDDVDSLSEVQMDAYREPIEPEPDQLTPESNKIYHILHTLRSTLHHKRQENKSAWKSIFPFLYSFHSS